MSKIKILPEILSNKIAAGEIVERPASVVKELIENALDAGSTRIIVTVEKGGRSLIQVSDNGVGMNHEDARLAIERYGTSKVYTEADLFSIKTLGFRGEALPSIASVSNFTLETKDDASPAGTRIEIKGGKIKDISEIGAPTGTMITVRDLFFNTPAREKFLKTVYTEMGHIGDIFSKIALPWHQVRFSLHHNGKHVRTLTTVSDPKERIAEVLGKKFGNELYPIKSDVHHLSISGWIAPSQKSRTTAAGIYLYVNGRFVRDRMIQHAIFEGYSGRLTKGTFPIGIIFLQVPPDQVDVNVHPTKNEVRFLCQHEIHEAIALIVSKTLQENDRIPFVALQSENFPVSESSIYPSLERNPQKESATPDWVVSEPDADFNKKDNNFLLPFEEKDVKRSQTIRDSELWEKYQFNGLRIMGQLHHTYIICETDDGMILVDQHAAHERILFEQLKDRSADSVKTSQKLLIPEIIDLAYIEATIVKKLIPGFKEIGLEIEPFGGNTVVVKSVPAILAKKEITPLIAEITEKISEITPDKDKETSGLKEIQKAIDASLMIIACHSAIKANQHLSDE